MPTDKAKLRELIMKAKEKLGDQNADIIAEAYGVQQWNNKTMKGLCPWHSERNPSYSYNKKDYTARCFSCGRSADAVQALMDGYDLTFTQAVKKLFELAEMDVLWDKTQKDRAYRYPHEEMELTQDVIDYMAMREISEETLRKCGIQSDGNGNIAFPYRDENDQLLTMKYRPAHKINKADKDRKCWAQKDADTTPVLFNMNRCNPEYPLVVCEGEIDCLSVYEAGYHNVVSIPFGASSMTFIDHCYNWLDQFSEIILAGDGDEAGTKFNREAATRLGAWRCKILEIPNHGFSKTANREIAIKDCNEILFCYGKDFLVDLIRNAHETPIRSVVDIMDVQPVDLQSLDGIKTGLAPLDKMLGKLYYGTVTLVSGKAASGKSSLVSTILCNAMDSGVNSWIYSGELNEQTNRNWIDYIFAGPRNVESSDAPDGSQFYRIKEGVSGEISRFYRGRCFIYKDGQTSDIDALLQSAEDVVRRYNCKILVLDNLMTITDSNDEELASQKNIMVKAVSFATKYNVAILLVCHLRKVAKGQQITLDDISGTAKLGNLCHRNITLARITQEEKNGTAENSQTPQELRQYDVQISCSKDRMRGRVGSVGVWFDEASRRFYSSPAELDRKYAWDKKKYEKDLPWPHGDCEEVIGPKQGGA